jgi:hypothetical protein
MNGILSENGATARLAVGLCILLLGAVFIDLFITLLYTYLKIYIIVCQ